MELEIFKPCDKCGKKCPAENKDSKPKMFEQTGELYHFEGGLLCFGCFFKMSVRGF